jgi:hypothetical protein
MLENSLMPAQLADFQGQLHGVTTNTKNSETVHMLSISVKKSNV